MNMSRAMSVTELGCFGIGASQQNDEATQVMNIYIKKKHTF